MIVPALDDVMTGRVKFSEVRQVDVEDLLSGRDPVRIDDVEVQGAVSARQGGHGDRGWRLHGLGAVPPDRAL